MGDDLIRSIWGIEDFEWSAIAARGQSGGIITIWRKDVVNPKFSFMGDGYLGINCLWKGLNCCIMNFYSSCNNLVKVKSNFPVSEWLLGGDFNATKLEEERKGKGRANSSEMANFSAFIDVMELLDIPVIGNLYTCFNSSGSCKSILDRFLISGVLSKE